MQKIIIAAALCAVSFAAAAQPVTAGSESLSLAGANNQGVRVENQFNTAAPSPMTHGVIDNKGIPANVQLTAIAPPPSPRTCADTGFSGGGGNKSGGITVAFGTGAEEGCDVGRDIEMVAWAFKLPPESVEYRFAIQRLCSKKSIRKSMEDAGEGARCQTAEQRQQRAEAILNDRPQVAQLSSDPLIRARQLGQ